MASQDKCYVTCPNYYWNDTTGASFVCTSCPQYCLTCLASTLCTLCQPNYYLLGFQTINCTATCPTGYYTNTTSNSCLQCLVNCTNCTDLYNCGGCVAGFYLDAVDKLCYNCHASCLSCAGPGGDQCNTCQYPLYYKDGMCTNLTCPPTSYVDSAKGCTLCSDLFASSLTCNVSNILTCKTTYVLQNNACVGCSSVSGFYLDSNNACR
jgi:proprotein convertase subtilisin/kexin type 5